MELEVEITSETRDILNNYDADKLLDTVSKEYMPNVISMNIYSEKVKLLPLAIKVDLSEERNIINVEKYRDKIRKLIPSICDAVDEYRTDDLYKICDSILNLRPKAHPMMHYQLEKIFCYLNDDGYGDVEWGLIQADAFSKEFAKKWVIIKPYDMSFKEIKLLANVACYLEYQEQNKGE